MKLNLIKLLIVLSIIVGVAVYFIYYLTTHDIINDVDYKIKNEIIKNLLTVISGAVIGGIISLIFKTYENSREKSKLRVEAKVEFMKRLGELYRLIKSTRRKLAANGLKNSYSELIIPIVKDQIHFYHKEMETVNSVQLELEGLVVAVQNYNLFNYSSEVSSNLQRMETFLRNILEEYEVNYRSLKISENCRLDNLVKLLEFTTEGKSGEKSHFKNQFSDAYYKILLHLN